MFHGVFNFKIFESEGMIQYSFEHKKFDFLASRTMIMKSQHCKVRICVLHSYPGRRLLFLFSCQYLSVPLYLLAAYPSSFDIADDMKELYSINTGGTHSNDSNY